MKKWKQALCIVLIIMGVLVVAAVAIGILNATVFDGAINFGWTDYRYESDGYTAGEGTVFDAGITSVSVDWLEGDVQIEVCQDDFISVSEFGEGVLSEAQQLHWRVTDGTLSVKSRESAWFFGSDPEKKLVLRIPEKMLAQLDLLSVASHDGDVTLKMVSAHSVNVECKDGDVWATMPQTPQALRITAKDGKASIQLPKNASFRLNWIKNEGALVTNFAAVENNGYVVGSGESQFDITTDDEDLIVEFLP